MSKIIKQNTSLDEPLEKRELEKAIFEKEKTLNELIDEIEQLKVCQTKMKMSPLICNDSNMHTASMDDLLVVSSLIYEELV